jgi:hypothetical protein
VVPNDDGERNGVRPRRCGYRHEDACVRSGEGCRGTVDRRTEDYGAYRLPFNQFEFSVDRKSISFNAGGIASGRATLPATDVKRKSAAKRHRR